MLRVRACLVSTAGADAGRLLLRLCVGLSMAINHGSATLRGWPHAAADYPDPIGLGGEASMALMIGAELVCALLVAAGLLTRLASIPPVVGMAVAFFVFHASDPFAKKELAFLYLVGFTTVLLLGPGRVSLDALLFGPKPETGKESS